LRKFLLPAVFLFLSSSAFCVTEEVRPEAIAVGSSASPSVDSPGALQASGSAYPIPQQSEVIGSRDAYGEITYADGDLGSTYISVDSWIYPALLRLHAMGYLDTAFINMRPWTRRSVLHMLQRSEIDINGDGNEQAMDILATTMAALQGEIPAKGTPRGSVYGIESGYARAMVNSGTVLRDSYHVGQSYINDYGRPYGEGFNTYNGVSTLAELGRFSLHVRGEYQHAASAGGYTLAQNQALVAPDFYTYNDQLLTVPGLHVNTRDYFRLIDASLSFHILGHEISGGKTDNWLSPARGGSMALSNNAESMYALRINRIEPLHVPLLSRLIGPLRYDFSVGSLKGHQFPNSPWMHSEKFSFAPTSNFQFGFSRSVIWGGKGHEPVTFHTFLRSFFHFDDVTPEQKASPEDPGARYSFFDFSWRLPFLTHWATLYADTMAHDDVTPPSAPRRAAYRTGVYLSHLPKLPKMDLRVEAVSTDPNTSRSVQGRFNYFEIIQLEGYTNKGFIMGDWIGREAKGGQLWLTYHLSPNESIEFEYRNKKIPKDFIPLGTTQNTFTVTAIKRFYRDLEVNAAVSYEPWKAPFVANGEQHLTTGNIQVKWYPRLHTGTQLP